MGKRVHLQAEGPGQRNPLEGRQCEPEPRVRSFLRSVIVPKDLHLPVRARASSTGRVVHAGIIARSR